MKRRIVFGQLMCLFFIIIFSYVKANTVSAAVPRLWDVVAQTEDLLQAIESKIDLIDDVQINDFSGTFTALQKIVDKSCTVQSIIDQVSGALENNEQALLTACSTLEVIDMRIQETQTIATVINEIDFSGTWTLINAIEDSLCAKFTVMFSDFDRIESKIDNFSAQELNNYIDTFTTIEEIADDVYDTLTTIEFINVDVMSRFDSIDAMLTMVKQQTYSINSNIDIIDVSVANSFNSTFTVLEEILQKACTLESKVDALFDIEASDLDGTFTAINVLVQKSCTIESKIDISNDCISIIDDQIIILNEKSNTALSKLCVLDLDIETINSFVEIIDSKIDQIESQVCSLESAIENTDILLSIASKVCTIESTVENISGHMEYIESAVDSQATQIITIESYLDAIDGELAATISKACTIESKVDNLAAYSKTINSDIDSTLLVLETIESKISQIDMTSIIDKSCTLESKVDVLNEAVSCIDGTVLTISSQVDLVNSTVNMINSQIDDAEETALTIESVVELLGSNLDTIFLKTCTVVSTLDHVNSSIQIDQQCFVTIESYLDTMSIDFQETWTILSVIEEKACSVLDIVDTIDSKVDVLLENSGIDLSGTFTALADLEQKMCTVESKVDAAAITTLSLNCITQQDLNGTFTMLDAMYEKAYSAHSKLDVVTVNLADIVDSFGIPIRQEDVGTTGTILDIPGRYFLAENITFDPESPDLAAIVIDNDNIEFSMLRRTISQTGSVNNVDGICIAQGIRGVNITQGSLRNFTGNGVVLQNGASDIFLSSMNIKDVGKHAIDCAQTCTSIIIEDAMIGGSGGNGINIDAASDLIIRECIITDNGLSTTNSGIYINSCNRVLISECMTTTNAGYGYSFTSTATAVDIVLEKCKAYYNIDHGIFMSHVNSSVIKGCMSSENGGDGIRVNDCKNLEIIQNFCMDNTDNGIVLGTESVGSSNCYVAENSLLLTGSVNLKEESGSGPNSILTNFALSVNGGNNYATDSHRTYLNFVTIDQSGTFPTPQPIKWHNISMTT